MSNDMMVSPRAAAPEGRSSQGKNKKKEEEQTSFADVLTQTLGAGSQCTASDAGHSGESVTAVSETEMKAEPVDAARTLLGLSGNGAQTEAEAVFMLRGYAERGIWAGAKAAGVTNQAEGILTGEGGGAQMASDLQSMTLPIGRPMAGMGQQEQRMNQLKEGMNPQQAPTGPETGERPLESEGMTKILQTGTAETQQSDGREMGEEAGILKAEAAKSGESEVKRSQDIYPQLDVQGSKDQGGPMITIKVAEPYHMAGQALTQKVSDSIGQQLQAGARHYQIQLEPEQLGRIEVELSMNHGQTVVKLTCESQETARLLNDHARSMAALLEPHGATEVTVQVRQENEPLWYQQQGQRQGQGDEGQSRERQEKKKQKKQEGSDFLEQLRLGLNRI